MTSFAALFAIFLAEVAAAGMQDRQPILAGQIQQESAWNTEAISYTKCCFGVAQFSTPTWGQYSKEVTPSCAGVEPFDAACSFRAQALFMKRNFRAYRHAATDRDQIAFALAVYNGGGGNLRKEVRSCEKDPRCDTTRWYEHVADKCMRAAWACTENREYPDRIARYAEERFS